MSYSEADGSLYTDKEFIFPPELPRRNFLPLKVGGFGGIQWYRTLSLKQLLTLKSTYPDAKLVIGNTEVGIEMRLKNQSYKVLISVTHVPELNVLKVDKEGMEIGASTRLSDLQEALIMAVKEREPHETYACKALIEQLKWFAGKKIKNVKYLHSQSYIRFKSSVDVCWSKISSCRY